MSRKRTEACGRCGMSTVVDAVADESADSGGDGSGRRRDPTAGGRIELDDARLRAVSPSAWLAGLRRRLDAIAIRFTYDRPDRR